MGGSRDLTLLDYREDWAVIPYLVLSVLGALVSIWDVFTTGAFMLAWTPNIIAEIPFLLAGAIVNLISRFTLSRAGLSVMDSSRLRVVEDQKLVTSGVYRYIRHPMYLGEFGKNIGVPLFFNSMMGMVVMILANLFLLIRIEIEEEMLIKEFGEEYMEYRKRTKKLIPYLY